MQTNAEYFATLTVSTLKEILKDFNFVGFSAMRKGELVQAVTVLTDGAHIDALNEQDTREIVSLASSQSFLVPTKVKATPMSAEARMTYYSAQNGSTRLTARQERRMIKKAKRGRKVAA